MAPVWQDREGTRRTLLSARGLDLQWQKTGLRACCWRKKWALHEHLEKKEAQLAECLAASILDPQTLSHVRLVSVYNGIYNEYLQVACTMSLLQ
jgi:hypothetical protein